MRVAYAESESVAAASEGLTQPAQKGAEEDPVAVVEIGTELKEDPSLAAWVVCGDVQGTAADAAESAEGLE